jgi:fatty-acyl-CoA synthase
VVVLADEAPSQAIPWDEWLARGHRPAPRTSVRGGPHPDVVMHTSGTTTGRSKSTPLHMSKAGLDTALRMMEGFDVDPDITLFTPCPLYHAAPMLLTGLCMSVGGHTVLANQFTDDALESMLLHGSTHAFLVPTLLERLSRQPPPMLARVRRSPMRAMISGGSALRSNLKNILLDALGPVLYDFYGATEMGIVSIASPGDLATAPDSVGRILRGVEAMVVDDGGQRLPSGAVGELFVRSDTMTNDSDSLVPGWVSAGDVARIQDGRLFIVDRKRDVVISGGVNLFPVDIELALECHPSVREAAAFGLPDPEWGEALHTVVVIEPGHELDVEALRAHCKTQLAHYAIPKSFRQVDSLPRSPTGKVLRRMLRDQSSPTA